MNKLIAATAALLVVSGAAFAGEAAKPSAACATVTSERSVKIDCTSTGSLKAASTADATRKTTDNRNWGLGVNPWIVPTFN